MNIFGIIYQIVNKANGKIYIGQTIKTLRERWSQHLCRHNSKHLGSAIRKYGKDTFVMEEIDSATSKEELDYLEKYWIRFYRSDDRLKGYNLTIGGGSSRRSAEARVSRSKFFVQCIETGIIFASAKDAHRATGISNVNIKKAVDQQGMAGGYHWRIIEPAKVNRDNVVATDFVLVSRPPNMCARPVICCETGKIYPSVTVIANICEIGHARMRRLIRDRRVYNGFTYRYEKDEVLSKKQKEGRARAMLAASKPIRCIEDDVTFSSMQEAAKTYGTDGKYLGQIISEFDGYFARVNRTFAYVS